MARTKLDLKNTDIATTRANVSNVDSEIIDFEVPRGFYWQIPPDSQIKMWLRTKETFDGDGATTVFNLASDIIDSPNFATKDAFTKPEGDAYCFVGGTPTPAYTIDYAANTITFQVAPAVGTDNVAVYYIFKPATIVLRINNANKTSFKNVMANQLGSAFHEANQGHKDQMVLARNEASLDEQEHLTLRILSTPIVSWEADGDSYFEIEVISRKKEKKPV